MRNYNLIAHNAQGASREFYGKSMADVKNQFDDAFEITDFEARIYDAQNGAFVQLKEMGKKTYKNPTSYS